MADVWESERLLGEFMSQPKFQEALQQVGMPEPKVEVYEIDRRR